MEAQINDIESDLDDVSILQTDDGNTSDIRINYRGDVSNVGTIIYDQNLCNDSDNQANLPWTKDLSTFDCHQFQGSIPGVTTILPAETTELDFYFMMMKSFQHIADENYVCRGENQKKQDPK